MKNQETNPNTKNSLTDLKPFVSNSMAKLPKTLVVTTLGFREIEREKHRVREKAVLVCVSGERNSKAFYIL